MKTYEISDTNREKMDRVQKSMEEAQEKIERGKRLQQEGQQEANQAQGYANALYDIIIDELDLDLNGESVSYENGKLIVN